MKAKELYQKLDKDFDLEHCRDEWQLDFNEYISENFKKRNMGLLADNSEEINKVYTAVFPSNEVLNKILSRKEKDILLLTHHPMVWEINKGPFKDISKELLPKLKENRISIYTLHTPLDRVGKYSTSTSFANALDIKYEKGFYEYYGFNGGTIGKTKIKTISELAEKVKGVVGHKVKVWCYGSEEIKDGKVALITGGGNDPKGLREMAKQEINAFITGVTRPSKDYKPALEAHAIAKENRINIIGATHYSTEKFACIAMIEYFKKLGLSCEFIKDKPDLNDLE